MARPKVIQSKIEAEWLPEHYDSNAEQQFNVSKAKGKVEVYVDLDRKIIQPDGIWGWIAHYVDDDLPKLPTALANEIIKAAEPKFVRVVYSCERFCVKEELYGKKPANQNIAAV